MLELKNGIIKPFYMLHVHRCIKQLNNILKNGGVIGFVTDTVWGIGCLPNSEKGVEKIYKIKKRDMNKPLILMSNSTENLFKYVKKVPNKAKELIKKFFPGALTVVLEKSELTGDFITSGKNTVGIRVPDNKIFAELCSLIDGKVLATTSANISGEEPALNFQSVVDKLSGVVDIIFEDEGENAKGIPSTVVSVLSDEIKILRQGSVNTNE